MITQYDFSEFAQIPVILLGLVQSLLPYVWVLTMVGLLLLMIPFGGYILYKIIIGNNQNNFRIKEHFTHKSRKTKYAVIGVLTFTILVFSLVNNGAGSVSAISISCPVTTLQANVPVYISVSGLSGATTYQLNWTTNTVSNVTFTTGTSQTSIDKLISASVPNDGSGVITVDLMNSSGAVQSSLSLFIESPGTYFPLALYIGVGIPIGIAMIFISIISVFMAFAVKKR